MPPSWHRKAGFVSINDFLPIWMPVTIFLGTLQPKVSMILVGRDPLQHLHAAQARSPQYSRCWRMNDSDNDTSVPVDQCAAIFLNEAVRFVIAMRTMHISLRVHVKARSPLPFLQVIRSFLVYYFKPRISLLLLRCTQLLLHNTKIHLHEGR